MNNEELSDEDKIALAKAFILPISGRQHYALQFKLIMYSWGKEVEISEEEWKKAEELGWIEKE